MERAPAARPLACARGAAGRQTTFGGPRRGMAHHGWIPVAPGLRRCPGRSSYRCPVAVAVFVLRVFHAAGQKAGKNKSSPGGGLGVPPEPQTTYKRQKAPSFSPP